MTSTIYDLSNIDAEKYNIVFNQSIDELKRTLQDLCKNYYKSITEYDDKSTNQYLQEIRKYLELEIPALTQYIEYVLLLESNQILKKLIADDIPLYNPSEMQLSFQTYNDRKAEQIIKQENLSDADVSLIIDYNMAKMDIYCLQLSFDIGIDELKQKPLPPHLQKSKLLPINYVGDNEPESMAKLFFSMVNGYGGFE